MTFESSSLEAVNFLKDLIRIDTTNPPGNELVAIVHLQEILRKAGLTPFIQETAPGRGNLVVRLSGRGTKPPLLLSSHIDVVPAEKEKWSQPPFAANVHNGFIYGRGTIDMKNFAAMCLSTVLRAHREKWPLQRDIIMSVVSDEERGGIFGMKQLVEKHPELIKAEFALGEVGAYTAYVAGKPIYPIQAGEKGTAWLNIKLHGRPGHGSLPSANNVHHKVSAFLSRLYNTSAPYHPTPTFRAFLKEIRNLYPLPMRTALASVDSPLGPKILSSALKRSPKSFAGPLLAMMTNTVNVTGLSSGGEAPNVVPSEAILRIDGRLIPGQTADDLINEIRARVKIPFEYEILSTNSGHETATNTSLFKSLCQHIEQGHPESIAAPWLTIGYTDAGYLHKLGIQCYGFTPVKLNSDVNFADLYHGHDERIPIDGFVWGLGILQNVVKEFCC